MKTTLRAQDLQIGNWVQLKETNGIKIIGAFQILAIGKTYLCGVESGPLENDMVTLSFHGEVYSANIKSIEPIPITPELLEKNGFNGRLDVTSYKFYYGIDNRVILRLDKEYLNSNNELWVNVDSADYCTIAHCELTYLHELQNLLNICKINFEFNV